MLFSQLDRQAIKRLRDNWGSCFLITLVLCAVFLLAGILSYLIDQLAAQLGFYELSRLSSLFLTPLATLYIVSKIYLIYILVMPSISHLLRYLWCASQGKEQEDMEKFKRYKKRFGFIAFKYAVVTGAYMLIPLIPCTLTACLAGNIGQSFISQFSVLKIFFFTLFFLLFLILLVVSGMFFMNIIMVCAMCIINPEMKVKENLSLSRQMAKLRRTEIIIFNVKFLFLWLITSFIVPLPVFLMIYLVFTVINMEDTVGEYVVRQSKPEVQGDYFNCCEDRFFEDVENYINNNHK